MHLLPCTRPDSIGKYIYALSKFQGHITSIESDAERRREERRLLREAFEEQQRAIEEAEKERQRLHLLERKNKKKG